MFLLLFDFSTLFWNEFNALRQGSFLSVDEYDVNYKILMLFTTAGIIKTNAYMCWSWKISLPFYKKKSTKYTVFLFEKLDVVRFFSCLIYAFFKKSLKRCDLFCNNYVFFFSKNSFHYLCANLIFISHCL